MNKIVVSAGNFTALMQWGVIHQKSNGNFTRRWGDLADLHPMRRARVLFGDHCWARLDLEYEEQKPVLSVELWPTQFGSQPLTQILYMPPLTKFLEWDIIGTGGWAPSECNLNCQPSDHSWFDEPVTMPPPNYWVPYTYANW